MLLIVGTYKVPIYNIIHIETYIYLLHPAYKYFKSFYRQFKGWEKKNTSLNTEQ